MGMVVGINPSVGLTTLFVVLVAWVFGLSKLASPIARCRETVEAGDGSGAATACGPSLESDLGCDLGRIGHGTNI